MFFTLRNHPEWQRACGMVPPQDPLVLALERDRREKKNMPKRCCSSCDIGQRCIKQDKIHQDTDQGLEDIFKPPPKRRESMDLDDASPPESPVSSRTRQKPVLQAPLREAIGPEGTTMLIKVPFSTMDLEAWKKIAKDYRNDPVGVTKHLQFIMKQHNPDWNDVQLLLEAMTETEKQLILKTAGDLAGDYYQARRQDVKEFFPLQDPKWDPNRSAEREKLQAYQEWIIKGIERAIPKTINWSILYEIKQGPSESPSEFLDRLREAMRRNTPLDPGSEVGIQQLVSLFLGQSTGDIRRKLQKLRPSEGRNLEVLLEEAWRVFRNREETYKQGMQRLVAVVEEGRRREQGQKPRLGGEIREDVLDQVFPGVWATDRPGKAKNAAPIQVKLKEGKQSVRIRQYPLKNEDREGIRPIIENFLQLGLLKECQSDFNTPILPVRKPDGTYRVVQDLRAVNKITEDLYPVVANPYTLLTCLTPELTWFTVLDLKDAFFCLPLHEASQKIFAFEWENPRSGRRAHLTWTVLPQGFKNSPTLFGEQLAKDLESWEAPPEEGKLLQYVDDLLVATQTEEACVAWTVSLLNFLGLQGYRVSKKKAQIVKQRVIYLGYEISAGQRTLGQSRKEAICQTPKPQTIKELRTFLGMTGWCRLWIYNYGLHVKPLYALIADGNRDLHWTREATQAFNQLKEALMSAPALGLPDLLSSAEMKENLYIMTA
ncbi:uncharacterized protein [Melopsittacus undulatus]|uniref:uncharacterized protein n=1 Tax=Melopsittacus undulatus TaxID=13146 RepID=UPI00146EB068|nr:uncharacterized protein LOC117436160 [Melopsittacus undulatus]